MNKDTKSGIIIFAILIAVIIGVTGLSLRNNKGSSVKISTSNKANQIVLDGNYDKEEIKGYKSEYVAAIYIEGVIQEENQNYNQKWLLSTIKQLKNDKRNQGIVLFLETPGGAVYQADEVYLALQDYKTSGKKVYAYMGSMAASGGYYIACAANEIWANRNTLTGSIGVISAQFVDISSLLKEKGIRTAIIHSGKNKAMGHMTEAYTQEQLDIMQSICDECYDQFTSIVSTSRQMPLAEVRTLADGRIYTARQALENKLIDHVDSWENCLANFTEKVLEKPGIKIESYRKEKKQNIRDYITGQISDLFTNQAAAQLGIPAKAMKEINQMSDGPMYIYLQ
ncbi:signal peptide peptidase SppA, 36K type [Treponema sp. JC4]|uniref:signal peptide peptidase SppA n=1 Tax=Treponema sp. JC4 TaxID=1124982 RepID=UPI00025B0506|nr:signal peptide peptidase SppA [Treponema sp. JC4]EID85334.1 signal peptide peptidase SppA, 36K type [Treponema sp. JC4]